jgi:hypothetical protein
LLNALSRQRRSVAGVAPVYRRRGDVNVGGAAAEHVLGRVEDDVGRGAAEVADELLAGEDGDDDDLVAELAQGLGDVVLHRRVAQRLLRDECRVAIDSLLAVDQQRHTKAEGRRQRAEVLAVLRRLLPSAFCLLPSDHGNDGGGTRFFVACSNA